MKLGMYITAPEPISMTSFVNPSHQSLCLYAYPSIVARKHCYHSNKYTCNTEEFGNIILYAVHVTTKEGWLLVLSELLAVVL
jgi:hypothetical protein